jgi:hypothetical protein
MRRVLLSIAALALAAGCGPGSGATSGPRGSATPSGSAAPSATAATASCPLQLGIAGLIPPHFPDSSAADWTTMYEKLPETGSLLGVYTNWSDSADKAGQIPAAVSTAFGLAPRYGFTPLIALGLSRDKPGGGVESTVAWADSAERAEAAQAAVAVARQFEPRFLALGIEVNRLYESDPAGFEAYVSAYAEMYDSIKAASPSTLVFPIFQLETIKGDAYLMGGSDKRRPEWSLLDRFAGRMDLAAFTTYPFLGAASPADLPDDYYAEIASHTRAPIAFTEIGWPSAPLSSAPDSAYGGSPEEQAAFVRRFAELTRGLDVRAELWAFPDDLNADYPNAAMTSVSLRANDGSPKPALAIWQARAAAPCTPAS